MKTNYSILFLFVIFFISFQNDNIYSQNDSDFRGKLENVKIDKLLINLALDKNTEEIFTDKYKAFIKRHREFNRSRNRLLRSIEDNLDNELALDSILKLLVEAEEGLINNRKDFYSDISSLLTKKQIAKLIIFERRFAQEMRNAVGKFKRGRGRN